MVGKKTDQIGRTQEGALLSDDGATFDKLNQAINSCKDLVRQCALDTSPRYVRAVVPVLVVPTGVLWQVDYSSDGQRLSVPQQVPNATLFLDHTWTVDRPQHLGPLHYRLSHIEVVTIDALDGLVSSWAKLLVEYSQRTGRPFF